MKWFIGFYGTIAIVLACMLWGLPAAGVSRESQVQWAEGANANVQDANVYMLQKTLVPLAQLVSPTRRLIDLVIFLAFVIVAAYASIRSFHLVFLGGFGLKDVSKGQSQRAVALLIGAYVLYGFYLFAIH